MRAHIAGAALAALILAAGPISGQEASNPGAVADPVPAAGARPDSVPDHRDRPTAGDSTAPAGTTAPDSTASSTDSVRTAPTVPVSADTAADTTAASAPRPDTLRPPPPVPDSLARLRNLGTTVVHGRLRGRSAAQQERRDAAARKDVLSIEEIQEHPDPSVADALERAPGVTVQRSLGEGSYVQVRGTEPRLSSVTVNGEKLGSTSGDTRAVDLAVIPVDQLSRIEVSKVLMPEMDGDAIGGTVNLVTPSATDTHLVFKALLASGWNRLSGEPLWQGSAALSQRFLREGALGVYLGGSWFDDRTRTDGLEEKWDTTAGNHDVIWNLDLRRYRNERTRAGASGRIDWRIDDGDLLYATGNWNRVEDVQDRSRLTVQREGAQQRNPATPDSFMTDDDLKYTREVRTQDRVRDVFQGSVGTGLRIGPAAFGLVGAGSTSRTDQEPNFRAIFVPQHQMNSYVDPSDPDAPTFDAFYYPRPATVDPRLFQASEYLMSKLILVSRRSREDDLHARTDLRWAPDPDSSLLLSAGGKWGWNHKWQFLSGQEFGMAAGQQAPDLSRFPATGSQSFYHGHYDLSPIPDAGSVRSWFESNRALLDSTGSSDMHIQDDPQNYSTTQIQGAGYAQARWKSGDLAATGGARWESHDVRSTGNVVVTQADESWEASIPRTSDRTFDFLLPMATAKWTPSRELLLRASYSRSFVLPDAMDLLPTTQVDLLDLTETVGNPDLKPTLSDAVELDLEWYHAHRAFASAGLFGKRLEDYIFPEVWGQWDPIRKANFTYFGKANGDHAWLGGLELEVHQPLWFLPWVLSGLGVDANWTWTASTTVLPGRTGTSTLPGQSAQSGNLGLRFDLQGFSAVAAWNVQGPFLYQLGPVDGSDTWVDRHLRLDVSASQRLWGGLLVYAHLANLTDAPYRLYQGTRDHPVQIEYTGLSGEAGVRLSL
jgi:TonB-dependent receptor